MTNGNKQYSIYGLIDGRDQTVFYVGRTSKEPQKRLTEHFNQLEGNSLRQERMKEIINGHDSTVELVVLETDIEGEKRAFTREVFWIELFIGSGARLTNASVDYGGTYFLTEPYSENGARSAKAVHDRSWSIEITKSGISKKQTSKGNKGKNLTVEEKIDKQIRTLKADLKSIQDALSRLEDNENQQQSREQIIKEIDSLKSLVKKNGQMAHGVTDYKNMPSLKTVGSDIGKQSIKKPSMKITSPGSSPLSITKQLLKALKSKGALVHKARLAPFKIVGSKKSDFFRAEDQSSKEILTGKRLNPVKLRIIRDENKRRGHLLNSHLPFTVEEKDALEKMISDGATDEALVKYFQRPLVTIKRFLKNY